MALNVKTEDFVASVSPSPVTARSWLPSTAPADTQIETAQVGWQGRPAASVSLRLTAWSTTTTQLLTRPSEHAQGLHTCPQEFRAMEERYAEALKQPAQQANSIATRV